MAWMTFIYRNFLLAGPFVSQQQTSGIAKLLEELGSGLEPEAQDICREVALWFPSKSSPAQKLDRETRLALASGVMKTFLEGDFHFCPSCVLQFPTPGDSCQSSTPHSTASDPAPSLHSEGNVVLLPSRADAGTKRDMDRGTMQDLGKCKRLKDFGSQWQWPNLKCHWSLLQLSEAFTTSVEDAEPSIFLTGIQQLWSHQGQDDKLFLFSFSGSVRWWLEIWAFLFIVFKSISFPSIFERVILGRGFIDLGLKCLHPSCAFEVAFGMLLWKGGTCVRTNILPGNSYKPWPPQFCS